MLTKCLNDIKKKTLSNLKISPVHTTHNLFLVGSHLLTSNQAFHSKILAPGFLLFSTTLLVSRWSYYLHNCSNSLVSQFFVYHSSIHSWGQTLDPLLSVTASPPHTPNILSPLQLLSNFLSLNSLTLLRPTVLWSYYTTSSICCSATHVLTSHLTHHKFYNQIL